MSAPETLHPDAGHNSEAIKRFPCRREMAIAAVILAVATLAGFHTLTRHPTDLLVGVQREGINDVTSYFLACRDLPRLLVSQYGQLPFWNPHSMAGSPYLGNPQAALFYPPNWLFLVIPARYAISWLMVVHHFWAGIGTYLLCRRYGCEWTAAVFGGMSFALAPYFVAQLGEGHYNQVCVASWLPWGLLAYEYFRVKPAKNFLFVVGVFVAGFFAGHPQEVFYLALLLSGFLAADLFVNYHAGQRLNAANLLRAWCYTGLFTFGLVAIDLIPIVMYTQQSARGEGMAIDAGLAMHLANLWELLNPMALGGPLNMDRLFYWECSCYFGVLPLLLAIVGVISAWRRRPVLGLALFWCVALNFAFGSGNWLYILAHKFVPGVSIFRAPSRIFFLSALAVSVIAAVGLDELVKRIHVDAQRRTLHRLLAFVAVVALIGAVFGPMPWEKMILGVSTSTWLCILFATVGLAVASLVPRLLHTAPLFVGLACFIELTMHASAILRTIPQESIRMDSVIVEMVRERKAPTRILVPHAILSDLEAWTHSIDKPQAYEPVPPIRYAVSLDALEKRAPEYAFELLQGFKPVGIFNLHRPMADMLGISFVAGPPHRPDGRNGWNEVWQGTIPPPFCLRGETPKPIRAALYENPTALPRAYVVGKVRTVPAKATLIDVLEKFDPRREIVMDNDPLPPSRRAEFAPAEIEEYTANRVILRAKLEKPGFLFLSDMWYPGWTATDNDNRTKILPANLAYRAIPLASGEHRVVMTYSPPGLMLGFAISLVTSFVLLLLKKGGTL